MPLPRKKRDKTSATITPTLWLLLACSIVFGLAAYGADPSWWSSPGTGSQGAVVTPEVVTNDGVVTTNYITNEYAVVVQGQLKQFTARAVDELNAHLSNGAGTNLNTMVSNWAADYRTNGYNATNIKPSDYTAMTVGQLKWIAGLIYGQLSNAGYTELTPSWLHQNTNTDSALAVIGQLKEVFDFDLSLSGPSGLTATPTASGTLDLSWTLPATNNVNSWLVEQQNSNGSWSILTTLTNATANSYSVTGLTNGVSYNFQVIASGTNNVSIPVAVTGTPVSAATAPTLSPTPARYLASQAVTVSSTLSGATIYYSTDGSDPTTNSPSVSNVSTFVDPAPLLSSGPFDSIQYDQPPDQTNQVIVFVHGINQPVPSYIASSETVFKRLFWSGYKGKFAAFRWPCLTPGGVWKSFSFNESEYRGWKCGGALKQFVASLPESSKNIFAFSQGNTVVGAAFEQGMTAHNYVMIEAAVPAGCYDTSSTVNGFADMLSAEASHQTPDWSNPTFAATPVIETGGGWARLSRLHCKSSFSRLRIWISCQL